MVQSIFYLMPSTNLYFQTVLLTHFLSNSLVVFLWENLLMTNDKHVLLFLTAVDTILGCY